MFSTRVDTIFGVTYIVLAPEHEYVADLIKGKENEAELRAFITRMKNMSDIDRTATDAKKEGMFTGAYAVNPVNNEKVPIWIANYVLADYGTGASWAYRLTTSATGNLPKNLTCPCAWSFRIKNRTSISRPWKGPTMNRAPWSIPVNSTV